MTWLRIDGEYIPDEFIKLVFPENSNGDVIPFPKHLASKRGILCLDRVTRRENTLYVYPGAGCDLLIAFAFANALSNVVGRDITTVHLVLGG